ncbi:MAG: ASKHA domain-containing protein [Lentisphaeria bacterium]|nr:ASKHA domain-containing protein [Lentisphaeria bacterium]
MDEHPIKKPHIRLVPQGIEIEADAGTPLQDLLYLNGVEFPCGGRGQCNRCKVRVVEGELPVADNAGLSDAETAAGYRLACRHQVGGDVALEVQQWNTPILIDDSTFEFTPEDGWGIAIDLGTTTLAAQLLDLRTAEVLAVRTALNAQARYGSDVMSRICHGVSFDGLWQLTRGIRKQLGNLIRNLCSDARGSRQSIRRIMIVGNTPMQHMFCGFDLSPLAYYPFEPKHVDTACFNAKELDWRLPKNPSVSFLPCLGGFVGSDILAGLLATGMHRHDDLSVLVDLGTNGEIVVGNCDRMLCASTAAGPAFEAARISMGMQATTGAISEVLPGSDGALECYTIGGGTPTGICGSGLVDAVATLLNLGQIHYSGRFKDQQRQITLEDPVVLTQRDVRELQLAKGAVAAGITMLVRQLGAEIADVSRVMVAGAFGNYVRYTSGRRIGLLPFREEIIKPVGNTALLGAKRSLFHNDDKDPEYRELRSRVEHVALSTDSEFQDRFVDQMMFPENA